MVLAVIAAIAVTILGLIPFKVAINRVQHSDSAAALGMLGPFLLTIALSFLILIAGIVACKLLAPDFLVVYLLTELIAFTVGVIVLGVLARQRLK